MYGWMNLKTLKSQRTAEKCSEKEIRRIQEEKETFLLYNPTQVPCHPKSPLTVLSTHMQRMLTLFKSLKTPQPEYINDLPNPGFFIAVSLSPVFLNLIIIPLFLRQHRKKEKRKDNVFKYLPLYQTLP